MRCRQRLPRAPMVRDHSATALSLCGGLKSCGGRCRATEHVARESHGHGLVRRQCVPFAQPGAECGGYTLPWLFEKCPPGMQCVADSAAVVDSPGTCQAGDPCEDFAWATCTEDSECPRSDQRCSSFRDGCVPSSCQCDGTCTDDCVTGVGVCESLSAQCAVWDGCAEACPPIDLPVCGADGVTYPNRCAAQCACMDIVSSTPPAAIRHLGLFDHLASACRQVSGGGC